MRRGHSLTRPDSAVVARGRRSFIKAVGGAALALPFARALQLNAVQAQTEGLPMSFIGFYHPHGVSSPLFKRQASDTEESFSLTFTESASRAQCVLAPLDAYKEKVVVIDGMDMISGSPGHDAPRMVLTGSGTGTAGASLDQYLAVERRLGNDTPFSSVNVSVGDNSSDHTQNISYTSSGTAQPKIEDPSAVFDMLFSGLVAVDDPAAAAKADLARRNGKSVLDYVSNEVTNLKTRLAAAEQAKLDLHLTSLRELEKQLAEFAGTCAAPNAPPKIDKLRRYNGGEPNFEQITNLQIDLLAQAIACDLTRFGTIWTNDLSAGAVNGTGITEYGMDVDVHNTVAHGYVMKRDGQAGDPASWALIGVQNRYSYSKLARLAQRMSEFGLLDSTVIMAATDMGDTSGHSSVNVPIVLVGGAGGKLRTGRYISLQDDCPPGNYWCQAPQKVQFPHNRLLVSIANLFGADIGSYGSPSTDPTLAQGEFSELA